MGNTSSVACLLAISTCLSTITSNSIKTTTSTSTATVSVKVTTTKSSSSTSSFNIASETYSIKPIASEYIVTPNNQSVAGAPAAAVPLNTVKGSNGQAIALNTSVATNTTIAAAKNSTISPTSVANTVLVIARDYASAYSAYSGLNGYGIPYQLLLVPQNGTILPPLTSSATAGIFSAIFVISEVSYDYGATGFRSALDATQWQALYNYQLTFGVRMVRLDVYPSSDSGTVALGSCCTSNLEQLISINDTTAFPTAGLIAGATLTTVGLYHYVAAVTNSSIAKPFAQFAPTTGFSTSSTAAVINNISGREQMVFFLSFATNWSPTSNFLQHAFIHWATRGLYTGYRRINLNTQIDDMFLQSDIYTAPNTTFRLRTTDLNIIKTWVPNINSKLPSGSVYFPEIGHNGNGNIDMAESMDDTGELCKTTSVDGPIDYTENPETSLEFQKVLGSGTSVWPAGVSTYPYKPACINVDPLKNWFATAANRDVFAHLSHTFTHEAENNATYSDIFKEISWNQAWLNQSTIAAAKRFSPKGLIPPAITGLHNGDAISAWAKNGLTSCVGDNTRPPLLNTQNEFWPLITTVANNGFDGMQVNPRWATSIYYNCDAPNCTVAEWINTSAGAGDIQSLLALERATASRHLLALHRDPYMFHQANLRVADATYTVVNGVSQQLSLFQMWVETVVNETTRLVTWPIISLKHDDFAQAFADRMARDLCNYAMTYTLDTTAKTITGVTLKCAAGVNTCNSLIPVTFPGKVKSTAGYTTEQIGSDPLTVWVKMKGSAVSFDLVTPLAW